MLSPLRVEMGDRGLRHRFGADFAEDACGRRVACDLMSEFGDKALAPVSPVVLPEDQWAFRYHRSSTARAR